MREIPVGSTDVRSFVELRDSNGALLTGEVFGDATLYFTRNGGTPTEVIAAEGTVGGAHVDGGFIEVDGANQPGVYQVDWPDPAFVFGADSVVISVGTTNSEGYNEEMVLTPSTALGTATVESAAAQDDTEVELPAGLDLHEGSYGFVYAGTGKGSAFVVDDYSTPATTAVKEPLTAALGTDSEVVFYSSPPFTANSVLNNLIAAIKAVTDLFQFSADNNVHADVHELVGGGELTGNGTDTPLSPPGA